MIFLLFFKAFLVIMASAGSSVEIGEFTSSEENVTETPMDDSACTWADETPAPPEERVPVPDALSHLLKHGVRFKSVRHWSHTARPMLVKSLSVYFTVDTVVTSQAVLEAFDSAGIEIDSITSIQWRASKRTWVVSFDDRLAKEAALEVSSVDIGGTTVFLGDCENRLVLVKIYEAPAEMPDTVVIGRLSYYGRVMSFRRDKIAQFIESGVRTARMAIHQPIPSIINLAGEYVRVWYPNQPKTCRNCGSPDHLVKDCSSVRCFNCERPGHRLEECQEEPKCTVCKSEEHRLAECPFVLYSANIDNTPKEQTDEDKQKEKDKYKEKLEQAKKKRQAAEQQQAQMQISAAKTTVKEKNKGKEREQDKGKNGADNGKDKGEDKADKADKRDKDNGKDKGDKGDDKSDEDKHRRERRERRSGSDRRDNSDDERGRRERREFEVWKEQQRRNRDERDEHYHSREYSRRDYHRDRSSRRGDDYYTDDDDGWTQVSYRRKRRYDR